VSGAGITALDHIDLNHFIALPVAAAVMLIISQQLSVAARSTPHVSVLFIPVHLRTSVQFPPGHHPGYI